MHTNQPALSRAPRPPMLVSNPHLDDHSTKIRNKNVPWDVCPLPLSLTTRANLLPGIPARRPHHRRGIGLNQKGRPPTPHARRVRLAVRGQHIRVSIPRPPQEGQSHRYTAVSPRMDHRRSHRYACARDHGFIPAADCGTDHEERIPLFAHTTQVDPDLPYLPLMRHLHLSFAM